MTIRWSYKAQTQQNQVAEYIYNEFGEKALRDFYNKLDKIETELLSFPELGKVEPLLAHLSRVYRSIWDTRREPKKQAKKTK